MLADGDQVMFFVTFSGTHQGPFEGIPLNGPLLGYFTV